MDCRKNVPGAIAVAFGAGILVGKLMPSEAFLWIFGMTLIFIGISLTR